MNKIKIGLWGLGISVLSLVARATIIELHNTGVEYFWDKLNPWSFSDFSALLILGIVAGVIGIGFLCWGLLKRT